MSWKDELKAEIDDVQESAIIRGDGDIVPATTKQVRELCALIKELIDHIPEESAETAIASALLNWDGDPK